MRQGPSRTTPAFPRTFIQWAQSTALPVAAVGDGSRASPATQPRLGPLVLWCGRLFLLVGSGFYGGEEAERRNTAHRVVRLWRRKPVVSQAICLLASLGGARAVECSSPGRQQLKIRWARSLRSNEDRSVPGSARWSLEKDARWVTGDWGSNGQWRQRRTTDSAPVSFLPGLPQCSPKQTWDGQAEKCGLNDSVIQPRAAPYPRGVGRGRSLW